MKIAKLAFFSVNVIGCYHSPFKFAARLQTLQNAKDDGKVIEQWLSLYSILIICVIPLKN